MQDAPERMNKLATCSEIVRILTDRRSRTVRLQLLHLSSVYQRSPGYYREALRPVIRVLLDRLEAMA